MRCMENRNCVLCVEQKSRPCCGKQEKGLLGLSAGRVCQALLDGSIFSMFCVIDSNGWIGSSLLIYRPFNEHWSCFLAMLHCLGNATCFTTASSNLGYQPSFTLLFLFVYFSLNQG